MDTQLEAVVARTAIVEQAYRFATSLDTCDWELLRSVVADDIVVDMSSYRREPHVFGLGEWLERIQRLFPNLTATQHLLGNPVVTVEGDHARAQVYVQAKHVRATQRGSATYDLGGYYDMQFVRHGDSWRIKYLALTVTWEEGNPSIMTEAVAAASTE